MKVYLVLQYKKQGDNFWAEAQAFTSPKEQSKALSSLPEGTDAEGMVVEVQKRVYKKKDLTEAHLTKVLQDPLFKESLQRLADK